MSGNDSGKHSFSEIEMGTSREAVAAWESVNDLVRKRVRTFAYLRRLHEGNAFFLSTVLISQDALVGKSESFDTLQ